MLNICIMGWSKLLWEFLKFYVINWLWDLSMIQTLLILTLLILILRKVFEAYVMLYTWYHSMIQALVKDLQCNELTTGSFNDPNTSDPNYSDLKVLEVYVMNCVWDLSMIPIFLKTSEVYVMVFSNDPNFSECFWSLCNDLHIESTKLKQRITQE